jgi:hypothetical protein
MHPNTVILMLLKTGYLRDIGNGISIPVLNSLREKAKIGNSGNVMLDQMPIFDILKKGNKFKLCGRFLMYLLNF